jgi:hypothetical protein
MAATHESRIRNAINNLKESTASIVTLLEGLGDDAARSEPQGGGWSPAQVGLHVAMTNELFAGILTGRVPMSKPAPAGFVEDPAVFSNAPSKIKTPDPLEPPTAGVTRTDAIARLQASQGTTISALKTLAPDRASGNVIELPIGRITLYQAAEFLGPHTTRHIAQIQRCLAGA